MSDSKRLDSEFKFVQLGALPGARAMADDSGSWNGPPADPSSQPIFDLNIEHSEPRQSLAQNHILAMLEAAEPPGTDPYNSVGRFVQVVRRRA
jgi:hypothetical protein